MTSLHFTEGQQQPPCAIHPSDQLLPNILDGLAVAKPFALYAQIPKSFTTYAEGYRKVTYRQFANAVNGVAWLLSERLGKGKRSEVLAYLGPNDIGYVAFILGASKAGYAILSPSSYLTKTEYAGLLDAANCTTLLTLAPPYASAVTQLVDSTSHGLTIIHVPSIFDLIDKPSLHYAYPYKYEDIKHKPLVLLHTSGTTGPPKPLIYTHWTANSFIRQLQATPLPENYNGISAIQSNRVFVAFPFFHAGGMMLPLIDSIARQTVLITGLGGVPMSADNIVQGMEHVDVDTLCAPSPFLEHIVKKAELFDILACRVRAIAFSGADMSEATGNALHAAGIHLTNMFSSSETMTVQTIRPLQNEMHDAWRYIQPHPYSNVEFRPHNEDLFELVWVKRGTAEHHSPVFTIFPHESEWKTRDLFSSHPENSNLWRFRGRADDMIYAASGEISNPIPFELEVSKSPLIQAAVMAGTGRRLKSLLVEPAGIDALARGSFVDRIWPVIEHANRLMSETSRVAKTHVLLTSPQLPMQRTGKGTVQRGQTLKLYKKHLDDLYLVEGDDSEIYSDPIPVHSTLGEVRSRAVGE